MAAIMPDKQTATAELLRAWTESQVQYVPTNATKFD